MKRVVLLIVMVILLISCSASSAGDLDSGTLPSDTETTTLPSWSTDTYGYSECSSDVRLVVTPKPLVSGDVQALISGGYEFMTVVQFHGMFYWYFVKHDCSYNGEYYWFGGVLYDN